ncbi:hypothetical protein WME91_29910 [Sorangium sp. So ce269]
MIEREPKLIVWDLDDTFWRGTLTEGPVERVDAHVALVERLARRGVVSAIASKNDLDAARAELERMGVWELFVFPKIAWSPKGPLVRRIIEQARLRAVDVLFVDDIAAHREEVRLANEGIAVAPPEALAGIDPARWGKDDPALSRLSHYKILEAKEEAGAAFFSVPRDPIEFLRGAGIEVRIGGREACLAHFERVAELFERTNRLNFSKIRLPRQGLRALLSDARADVGAVWVRDRFGDYGLSGFYAVISGELAHFLFSCRVLDMGVEHFVFRHLEAHHPGLRCRFAGGLGRDASFVTLSSEPPLPSPAGAAGGYRVAFKGACDLEIAASILSRYVETSQELQIPLPSGVSDVFSSHTEYLRQRGAPVPDDLAFIGPQTTQSRVLDADFDALVVGLSVDYWSGLYRRNATGQRIAAGWFFCDLFGEEAAREYPEFVAWEDASGPRGYLAAHRDRIRKDYTFEGGVSPARFEENLRWLCAQVPAGRSLVLVNVADAGDASCPHGARVNPLLRERYRQLNAVVDRVVSEEPAARLVDVRAIARPEDIQDMHTHLTRRCYVEIATELLALVLPARDARRRGGAAAQLPGG